MRGAAISPEALLAQRVSAWAKLLPTSRTLVIPQVNQVLNSYSSGCGWPSRESCTCICPWAVHGHRVGRKRTACNRSLTSSCSLRSQGRPSGVRRGRGWNRVVGRAPPRPRVSPRPMACHLRPMTDCFRFSHSRICKLLKIKGIWWARRDSNPGPPACEAGALTS